MLIGSSKVLVLTSKMLIDIFKKLNVAATYIHITLEMLVVTL
jgi:hypothetical protein